MGPYFSRWTTKKVANIIIDPSRKTHANEVCTGVGIAELAVGGSAGAAAVADEYARAQKPYDSNPVRKAKAPTIRTVKALQELADCEFGWGF